MEQREEGAERLFPTDRVSDSGRRVKQTERSERQQSTHREKNKKKKKSIKRKA